MLFSDLLARLVAIVPLPSAPPRPRLVEQASSPTVR
jgi:hypothetical protein